MCMCVFVCIFLSFVRGCTCWYEVKYIIIIIIIIIIYRHTHSLEDSLVVFWLRLDQWAVALLQFLWKQMP